MRGTFPIVTGLPPGIDAHDWGQLEDAFGSAVDFPGDLRLALQGDSDTRQAHMRHLWESIWHQGTVYTVTPHTVPFLAHVVGDSELPDTTRANMAMLLSEIAEPLSFALPGENRHHRVDWMRLPTDPIPSRDLASECWHAVASVVGALVPIIEHAGPPLQAGLVAVSAAVFAALDADATAALARIPQQADPRLVLASNVVVALSTGRNSDVASMLESVRDDEGVRWHLSSFEGFVLSAERRAIETAKFLCADYADRDIWSGD